MLLAADQYDIQAAFTVPNGAVNFRRSTDANF
jgi:hypothetical protein